MRLITHIIIVSQRCFFHKLLEMTGQEVWRDFPKDDHNIRERPHYDLCKKGRVSFGLYVRREFKSFCAMHAFTLNVPYD